MTAGVSHLSCVSGGGYELSIEIPELLRAVTECNYLCRAYKCEVLQPTPQTSIVAQSP